MEHPSPVPGLTDQRYYHVAVFSARGEDLTTDWILDRIGRSNRIHPGRIDLARTADGGRGLNGVDGWHHLAFHRLTESAAFAGSPESRERLASERSDECDFDLFLGEIRTGAGGRDGIDRILALGTGYASLTSHIIRVLLGTGDLIPISRFITAKLQEIIDHGRTSPHDDRDVDITVTGLNAFIPGDKAVTGIRLAGRRILEGGLYDGLERFLRTGGGSEASLPVEEPGERGRPLIPQAVRLTGTARLTGKGCSLSFANDGSCKVWMRKHGGSLPQFGATIRELTRTRLLAESVDHPRWSDDTSF